MRNIVSYVAIVAIALLVVMPLFVNTQDIKVSRRYPEDVSNVKGWAGYIIYVILVLLFPFLFILVLYIVSFFIWCGRCTCQLCGGSRSREDGYSKGNVTFHKGAFVVFYLGITFLLVLSIIFTITFSATLKRMQRDVVTALDTVDSRVDTAINIVDTLDSRINSTFAKTDDVVKEVDGFTDALNDIGAAVTDSNAQVSSMSTSLSIIDTKLQDLRTSLDNIAQDVADSPDPSSVPSVSESQSYLNQASSALTSVSNQINDVTSQVGDLKTSVVQQITDLKDQIIGSAGSLSGDAEGPLNETKKAKEQVDKYYGIGKKVVNAVDGVRLALLLLMYIVFIALFTVGCIGACVGWRWTVKCSICLSFFLPVIFIVIATFHLFILVGLTDVCREGEPAVRRSQSVIDKLVGGGSARSMLVPLKQNDLSFDADQFTNVTFLMDKILYCSGNGSLLEVISGFNQDLFNTSKYTEEFNRAIQSAIGEYNVTKITSGALAQVGDFRSFSGLVDSPELTNKLNNITALLNVVYEKLNDTSAFGYAEDEAMNLLDSVNEQSAEIGGDYFTLDNISLLDPANSPYNQNQTFFENSRDALIEFRDRRDQAQQAIERVRTELNTANQTIFDIVEELEAIRGYIGNTFANADRVRSSISDIDQVYRNIVDEAFKVFDYAQSQLGTLVDDVLDLAKCSFIGSFYRNTKENGCNKLPPYSGLVSLASYLSIIWLLFWFVFLLPVTKRVGNYDRQVDDQDHGGEMMDLNH